MIKHHSLAHQDSSLYYNLTNARHHYASSKSDSSLRSNRNSLKDKIKKKVEIKIQEDKPHASSHIKIKKTSQTNKEN